MILLQFILGIAVLIIIHEIGHFLASRLMKVEVEEFGLGLPPRVATLFKYKGTEYTLNALPLGGFVRPKGENDPSIAGGLAAASPWVRLGVYFAGPLMNLLLGVLLSILFVYRLGEPVTDKVVIKLVAPESPAATADLRPGDQILMINGEAIDSIEKCQQLISQNLGQPVQLMLLRGEERLQVTLTPRRNPPPNQGAMGVVLTYPTRPIPLSLAVSRGTAQAVEYLKGVLHLPARMLQGQVSPEEGRVVGFKGMYDIYQELQEPLYFFMIISLTLGFMNLLPIPALDGGRILFTLPEIIIGRRIPPRFENVVNTISYILLLLLLLYVNIQDFINPIQLNP